MTSYCLVKDNQIQIPPGNLPYAYGDTSNLPHMTDTELATLGWFPVIGDEPEYDARIQTISIPSYEIGSTEVTRSFTVSDIPLETVINNKKLEIQAQRDAKIYGNVVWNGHPVDTDDKSQARLTGALILVSNPAASGININWRMADDSVISMSPEDITTMALFVGEFINECFTAQAAHETNLLSLTSALEIANYDCTSNWPSNSYSA